MSLLAGIGGATGVRRSHQFSTDLDGGDQAKVRTVTTKRRPDRFLAPVHKHLLWALVSPAGGGVQLPSITMAQ